MIKTELIEDNSKEFNKLIRYGNEITMIYGVPASGKTTLVKLAAISQASKNKKVIFIDTEFGFSIDRFKQLAGKNYRQILDNIIFFRPKSLSEQRKVVKGLVDIIESGKISLVIMDTIGMHYRAELKKDDKYANRTINEGLRIFKWINNKGIPVIITNQVYSDLKNNIRNVGGDMIFNSSDRVIFLDKDPRSLTVKKPEGIKAKFEIKEDGIYLVK